MLGKQAIVPFDSKVLDRTVGLGCKKSQLSQLLPREDALRRSLAEFGRRLNQVVNLMNGQNDDLRY